MNNEQLEIKVNRSVQESVFIPIPSYWKGGAFVYKIISTEKCIQVCESEFVNQKIQMNHAGLPFNVFPIATQITREEFEAAYEKVATNLHRLALDRGDDNVISETHENTNI